MSDFLMPALGADMQAGTLVAWRKHVGQTVARGEILAEVETEKGVIEVECFTPGVVEELLVSPGAKVPVGTLLAHIRAGEAAPGAHAASPPVEPVRAPVPQEAPAVTAPPSQIRQVHASPSVRQLLRERTSEPVHGSGREGTITREDVLGATTGTAPSTAHPMGTRTPISPLARRLAEERRVDFASLAGSGPGGYVIAQDVLQRASEPAPVARAPESSSMHAMRAAIAQAMARSKREIPHYYLSHTIDLGETLAWLNTENSRRSVEDRLLAGVLFVRAVALALAKTPELNAHYGPEGATTFRDVHVGVAVSLRGGGLIAPAIQHANRLSVDELSRAFKDVVNRARSGQLRSSELSSPTITITSLGERGVETVFPIIVPPQVAMVGFGTIVEKPVVYQGNVVARPTVTVTLAADHRVSDGHRGGLMLAAVESILKEPPKP